MNSLVNLPLLQVETREEAVKLGRYLIEYRVIQHVQDKYNFIDHPTKLYR